MKRILLAITVMSAVIVNAQERSVTLNTGDIIKGTNAIEAYNDVLVLKDINGIANVIRYSDIKQVNISRTSDRYNLSSLKQVTDTFGRINFYLNNEVKFVQINGNFRTALLLGNTEPNFDENTFRFKEQQYHLRKASGLGIVSAVMILAGGVTSIASALTPTNNNSNGKKVATIIGAGISGLGCVLLIPTFVELNKAGKEIRFKRF